MPIQEELLEFEERRQAILQDRLLQNSNIHVMVLSFVFLFEITFIGGAFPDHISDFDFIRYAESIVVLVLANIVLVASLVMLLTANSYHVSPWLDLDDYFDGGSHCKVWAMGKRYAILSASSENAKRVANVIFESRVLMITGVGMGALSVAIFLLNARGCSFICFFGVFNGFLTMVGSILIGTLVLILWCVKKTKELRRFVGRRKNLYDGACPMVDHAKASFNEFIYKYYSYADSGKQFR